jgi:hypothetical protein
MIYLNPTCRNVLGAFLLITTLVLSTVPVSAATSFSALAQPVPAANMTPHALGEDKINGVYEIAQAGRYMLYGGKFAQATSASGASSFSCGNFMLQDMTSHTSSCPIKFNGPVQAITVLPNNQAAFIGGQFTSVTSGGITHKRINVVKVNLATMTIDTSFDAKVTGGTVSDLHFIGTNLILCGSFKTVQGVARPALATVTHANGTLTNFINVSVSGSVASNAGAVQVYRMAINPQNSRAMIIGNFLKVAGKSHPRAASIIIGTASTSVSNWYAPVLANACAKKLPDYMRDVDFSPNGAEFVMGTTGGITKAPLLCDTVSMWPSTDSLNAQPRWVNYTPADTIHSVIHTGAIVYAGGHQKAHNTLLYVNGVKQNVAVVRTSGIGAINATSGKAYAWAAGRDRGEGAKKLLAVQADAYHPAGIYVGNDTEWWYDSGGNRVYKRERIAFLPVQ